MRSFVETVAKSEVDCDTNTGLYSPAGDNLGFAIGGQAKAFFSTNQFNVATKIVATELDINGNADISGTLASGYLNTQITHTSTDVTAANSNSTLRIGNTGAGNGVYNAIKFAANQQDMYIMAFNDQQQADRRLGFFLGSVAGDATTDERLSILGDGKVGIGNTDPSSALEVGDGSSTYVTIRNASAGDVSSGYNIKSGSTTTSSLYGNAAEGWTTVLSGGSLGFRVNNASSGFNPMNIDTSGRVTKPNQPCFSVAASYTNIPLATTTQVTLGTERFDVGSNLASNVFTAPVTGKYLFTYIFYFSSLDADHTTLDATIKTSNRQYQQTVQPSAFMNSDGNFSLTGSMICDMDANDTFFMN